MFDFESTGRVVQLLIALGCGISLFIFSYMGFQRLLFRILIVMIPFQFIDSPYGSMNMAITYVLGASMFLNQSWIKKKTKENWPLIWPIFIIIISFFLSWVLAPGIVRVKTLFYMIMLGSNAFLFFMTYHFISDRKDVVDLFNLMFICNVLVIMYCVIQILIGGAEYSLLDIKEFSLQSSQFYRARIAGPFNAVGITAEYIVIQCMLLAYYALNAHKYKMLIIAIVFCNIAILIGTGNRGGFISILLALFLFCYVFRKRLGMKKIFIISLTFSMTLICASYLMINYTHYNVIYDRLLGTQMDGITPDTRDGSQGWPLVVEKILEKPVLGHGPKLLRKQDYPTSRIWLEGSEIGFYPHNLYLYILYTLGVIGLLAYSFLGMRYITILSKLKMSLDKNDKFLSGLPKLGIIVFAIFLFDQMKVEFLRGSLLDYQHYLSVLFGMFCGLIKIRKDLLEEKSAI